MRSARSCRSHTCFPFCVAFVSVVVHFFCQIGGSGAPMVISRTPYRISFFGGGSDYPRWCEKHGGAVLAGSIDKYCYLTCRYLPPFFEHRIRVIYSKIETCREAADIEHPAVRAALEFLHIREGVEIHHDGDLPARSGMGSSSAFVVGILHALNALRGRMTSRQQLACDAMHLEQNILKEHVGCQDQVAVAYGGVNVVSFPPGGGFSVRPVILPEARLQEFQQHLMLLFTGVSRTSSDIAAQFTHTIEDHAARLRRVVEMVDEGVDLLLHNDLTGFGTLLHEAWMTKRQFSGAVSTARVDDIYARARAAGALGGKLLGAGGGGFMMLFVPPERRHRVETALADLLHVPFRFEAGGSQIIFYDPEPHGDVQ
jgi:D-glycero-alpha-D-manno-heptose-7-phosphate kinase